RRSVSHRIGKRHAELDDIGAGAGQSKEDGTRRLVVRIACGDERHQPLAALSVECRETAVDACGRLCHVPKATGNRGAAVGRPKGPPTTADCRLPTAAFLLTFPSPNVPPRRRYPCRHGRTCSSPEGCPWAGCAQASLRMPARAPAPAPE